MVVAIGSLANVPNAGAPITSPWAQDVTRLGVHPFANLAALNAATWPGLAAGAMACTVDNGHLWEREAGGWRLAQRPFMLAGSFAKLTTAGSVLTISLTGVQTLLAAFAVGTGGFSHLITAFGAGSGPSQAQFKLFVSNTGAGVADGTNVAFSYALYVVPSIGAVPVAT